MRRLTRRILHTRRITRGDDGISMILVAVSMVALIGMAAMVVDVGALVQERRTLQNGADAAALAVALDCAKGACGAAASTAGTFASANADDNLANIDSVCGSGPGLTACASPPAGFTTNYVQVNTSTRSSGGTGVVAFVFGQATGAGSGKTVRRTAVATWGKIGSVATVPLVISECDFGHRVGDVAHLPSPMTYVYFHGSSGDDDDDWECEYDEHHHDGDHDHGHGHDNDIPGGFGWISGSSGCRITVVVDTWVPDKPGASAPGDCNLADLLNTDIVVPIYDAVNGLSGANGTYHIAGFALFHLTGFKFPSMSAGLPGSGKCPASPSATCLYGQFLRFSTNLGDLTTAGTDYGTAVTRLAA